MSAGSMKRRTVLWSSRGTRAGGLTVSSSVVQALAPAVDWLDFLSSSLSPLELNGSEPVVLYAREYLQQVSELLNRTDRR